MILFGCWYFSTLNSGQYLYEQQHLVVCIIFVCTEQACRSLLPSRKKKSHALTIWYFVYIFIVADWLKLLSTINIEGSCHTTKITKLQSNVALNQSTFDHWYLLTDQLSKYRLVFSCTGTDDCFLYVIWTLEILNYWTPDYSLMLFLIRWGLWPLIFKDQSPRDFNPKATHVTLTLH